MREYKLHELKSSNIQYNKKDPKMGFLIIGITLILLTGIIIAASFIKKSEVVRTTGILSTTDKTYIMSQTGGKIKKVHKLNGDYVKEGDLLIELDAIQVEAQIISLSNKILYLELYINNIEIFINVLEAIDINEIQEIDNPFEKGEFYLQFVSFFESIKNIEDKVFDDEGNEVSKEQDEIIRERKQVIDQYLSQYYSQKSQYTYELSGNLGQKEAYEMTLDTYNIYAAKSGYITYSSNLDNSMVIGNDMLGTINEVLTKENVMIETFVSADNINYIEEGLEVEVSILGLMQSEYGLLRGTVVSISKDSIIMEENIYYKIIIKPNDIVLNGIKLISGQVGEIRIIYEKTTWMKWLIDKIGIH